MEIVKGNVFDSDTDIILVTANSYIKKDGALAMGAGAAKELAERFPEFPKLFGTIITENFSHLGYYGWLTSQQPLLSYRGVIQTKYHFKEKSTTTLIEKSLRDFIEAFSAVYLRFPTTSINYPGIGYGGLTREEVEPILHEVCDGYPITFYYL